MDARLIVTLLLLVIGLALFIAGSKKNVFRAKGGWKTFAIIFGLMLVIYAGIGTLGQLGAINLGDKAGAYFLSAGIISPGTGGTGNGGTGGTGGGATYQPTATYSTQDKYSTTSIAGTSYYKSGNNPAGTTALTNTDSSVSYTYWISNSTYWVKPIVFQGGGTKDIVNKESWNNASATVTLYDTVNRQSNSAGTYNTSMGANDQANIEITYQGTAKKSAGPFGGLMVVEYNSTLSSVTCTGNELLDSNPYHLTYTVTATTNAYKPFAYTSGIDDGSGSPRTINCQFLNGATAVGAGSPYYVKFIPANYYVTNAGNIVLDTEKFADGDTTRVGSVINLPSVTAYWGA